MINNWQDSLDEALIKGNCQLFKNIPHSDLHCHGITSAPFTAFQKINQKINKPPEIFKGFNAFSDYIRKNINQSLRTVNDFRFIIRSVFERLLSEGVIYTEMSFDITMPEFLSISEEDYLNIIFEEKSRFDDKITVCVEGGLDRLFDPYKLFKILKRMLSTGILGSIDLYGPENFRNIDNFIDIYKLADRHNLKLKAHVGELGQAGGVKEAVKKLNLHSVQHGIGAVSDKSVLSFLAKRRTVVNVCPTSNIHLGLVSNIKSHPIKTLFDAGVLVTVASDDYTIFGVSASQELINLYQTEVFSKEEIKRLIINSLDEVHA